MCFGGTQESRVKCHLVFISVFFPFPPPSKFFPLLEQCEGYKICLETVSAGLRVNAAEDCAWLGECCVGSGQFSLLSSSVEQ